MTGQQECMSYYVDPQEWMQIPEDESIQHGKIACPKC